jgi:bacterioferritin
MGKLLKPKLVVVSGKGPMKGNPKVIDQLNQALRDELTAINQYFLHAEMSENWGYKKYSKYIKKQSIDEMKHAEALMERILFLIGTGHREVREGYGRIGSGSRA